MEKLFTITYKVAGGRRNDFLEIYAKNMTEAINKFELIEHEVKGFTFKYNQYAIIKIES